MRIFLASLLCSTFLFGARVAAADAGCPAPTSPFERFDKEADVVRVRVVPGSQDPREGGVQFQFVVVETLRGSTKVGAKLAGASGGPCARTLADDAELVLPLGHADTVGVGNVDVGWATLPASIALQTAMAKTKATDVRGRAALVYRAATARAATKDDRAALRAYLAARPDVDAALTKAQRRRLDAVLGAR
jgi:hypothetical protein